MITNPIVLCELAPEHLDAVAAIESASSDHPWSRSLFAGELTMPVSERHWLVATVGNVTTSNDATDREVIGFGGMMLVGDEAHLMNIAIGSAYRRRGLAQRLLARLILDVVGMGARHVTLEVRTDNDAALRLYDSFGFEPAGVRKDYYGPGEDAAILWVHDIDAPSALAGLRHRDHGETS